MLDSKSLLIIKCITDLKLLWLRYSEAGHLKFLYGKLRAPQNNLKPHDHSQGLFRSYSLEITKSLIRKLV